MFCENCGKEIPDQSKFCDYCGAAQPVQAAGEAAPAGNAVPYENTAPAGNTAPYGNAAPYENAAPYGNAAAPGNGYAYTDERELLKGQQVTENVWLCPDGVYRWIYEFPMLSNPVLLITIWKVLGLAFIITYLIMLILNIATDCLYGLEGFLSLTKGFGLLLLFFLSLGVVAYIILAGMYGWKYMVLFEMDDKQVRHIQMRKQFKRAEAVGWLTAAAGIATGRIGVAGTGILAASRNSSVSNFSSVKSVKGSRLFNTIKLSQLLNRNQVYAESEDYDFVYRYIADHCVNAKIR